MFELGKRYLWGRTFSYKDMFIVEAIRIVGDNRAELKILWQRCYYGGGYTFVDRYYDLYEILKNQDTITPFSY